MGGADDDKCVDECGVAESMKRGTITIITKKFRSEVLLLHLAPRREADLGADLSSLHFLLKLITVDQVLITQLMIHLVTVSTVLQLLMGMGPASRNTHF